MNTPAVEKVENYHLQEQLKKMKKSRESRQIINLSLIVISVGISVAILVIALYNLLSRKSQKCMVSKSVGCQQVHCKKGERNCCARHNPRTGKCEKGKYHPETGACEYFSTEKNTAEGQNTTDEKFAGASHGATLRARMRLPDPRQSELTDPLFSQIYNPYQPITFR